MDKSRRRELIQEYKDRKKELGIISFKCIETNENFLGVSTDINADFNSNKMKLNTGTHPNKKLLQLWEKYGSDRFELNVLVELENKDATKDYTKELENIREDMISKNDNMYKIWR